MHQSRRDLRLCHPETGPARHRLTRPPIATIGRRSTAVVRAARGYALSIGRVSEALILGHYDHQLPGLDVGPWALEPTKQETRVMVFQFVYYLCWVGR